MDQTQTPLFDALVHFYKKKKFPIMFQAIKMAKYLWIKGDFYTRLTGY